MIRDNLRADRMKELESWEPCSTEGMIDGYHKILSIIESKPDYAEAPLFQLLSSTQTLANLVELEMMEGRLSDLDPTEVEYWNQTRG